MSVKRKDFAVGERVIWWRQERGGYGFAVRVEATVVSVSERRIYIELGDGSKRWVGITSVAREVVSHG